MFMCHKRATHPPLRLRPELHRRARPQRGPTFVPGRYPPHQADAGDAVLPRAYYPIREDAPWPADAGTAPGLWPWGDLDREPSYAPRDLNPGVELGPGSIGGSQRTVERGRRPRRGPTGPSPSSGCCGPGPRAWASTAAGPAPPPPFPPTHHYTYPDTAMLPLFSLPSPSPPPLLPPLPLLILTLMLTPLQPLPRLRPLPPLLLLPPLPLPLLLLLRLSPPMPPPLPLPPPPLPLAARFLPQLPLLRNWQLVGPVPHFWPGREA